MTVSGRIRSSAIDGGLWVASDRFIGGLVTNSINQVGFFNNGWRLIVQSDGKVGIGTATPADQTMLHIKETGYSTTTWKGRIVASGQFKAIAMGEYQNKVQISAYNAALDAAAHLFIQKESGNVGIGNIVSSTPAEKLEVIGNIKTDGIRVGTSPLITSLVSSQWVTNSTSIYYNTGNVDIGTDKTTGYKLSVEGKIRARDVEVNVAAWNDNVFDANYKIASLSEVEKYIKTHKHLSEVPSEKQVMANGISLSAMNAVLLKKVEELTLYVIDLEKRLKEVEK